MHCISDPCEINCSRCSSHWLGVFNAHTVKMISITTHLPLSETPAVAQSAGSRFRQSNTAFRSALGKHR